MSGNRMMIKATKAYHRRCVRQGTIISQPIMGYSAVGGDTIVLRNRHGVLATYRITDNGIRFVEDGNAEGRK
jgi:hypothetical protein